MPNNITNRLSFSGNAKEIQKMRESIKGLSDDGSEMAIDFNKIIPRPKELDIDSSSVGEIALSLLFGEEEIMRFLSTEEKQKRMREMSDKMLHDEIESAILYFRNIERHGCKTWYDWNIEKWGTKWNAYNQNPKINLPLQIFFDTAWSAPFPIIKELSRKFPSIEFTLSFADENTGSNAGITTFKNNQMIGEPFENGSDEAFELAFELCPHSKKYYSKIDGRYQYVDNE